jgi:glycosyltransferase involved in cell wall biosynthesis
MKIAFLTPEYPSELSGGGGISNYLYRMGKLLSELGHEPEIFVLSRHASETIIFDGVPIHRVNCRMNHPFLHFLYRESAKLIRFRSWRFSLGWMLQAKALAAALERRHAIAPFRFVQSADYCATGLLVRRRRDRIHAVRCSSAADLYSETDGTVSVEQLCRGYLERLSMRRAELAYAPSLNLAEHFDRVHKIKIHVVRPPSYCELKDFSLPPFPLPARFFLHFGQLMERKGTALLARALPIAWKMAPDLTMVWCGRCWDASKLESWRSLWGDRARQVQITGPLAKPQMYAVLQLADAAVLPSQVDNLPNTVIESLMFGIPVLGSRGASIDELIEEGRTGHLVALGDVDGLAETLVKMWLGESPVSKGFEWNSGIANEMRPQRAVANLICLLLMAKRRTGSHPVLC